MLKENFHLLSVEMSLDENGKLSAKADGAFAPIANTYLPYLVKVLNSLKIIAWKDGRVVYNLYNPPQPSKAGIRALVRKLKERVFGYVFPGTANIAVTAKCQCKCVHCSFARFKKTGAKELTTEQLKSAVKQSLDLGANLIIFVGGEPLLHPDICELIRSVPKDKAIVSIFTNGWALTDETAKELAEAGLDNLYVSIDSPVPEEHDSLRGIKGLFQRAIDGALAAKERGILVGLSTYATHERLASGKLERLIQFAQKTGFHEVTIFDCVPSGKFLRNVDGILTREEKKRIVELQNRYHWSEHPMGVIAQAWVNSPEGAGCFGAFSQLYLTPYGDVCPCDFNPISFGNILEEPLEKIWFRMTHHPDFCYRHATCRMQTPAYRKKYIDPIPDDATLPVPISNYADLPPLPKNELKKPDPTTLESGMR